MSGPDKVMLAIVCLFTFCFIVSYGTLKLADFITWFFGKR